MKTIQTGSSMVSGFLGTLTTEERTLLHLLDNQLPENNWEAPMELTQAGISAAVHVQRKHVPRTLKRLQTSSTQPVVMSQVLDNDGVFTH